MAITKDEKARVITTVTKYLSSTEPSTRKEIIEKVLNNYKFSENEKNNKSPNSKFNVIRSYIGTVLTDMLSNGDIIKKDDKYFLVKDESIIVKEEQCKSAIIALLKKKSHTKKELYSALQKHFKTDTTKTLEDDNNLKGLAGNLLNTLLKDKKIILEDGMYSLNVQVGKKVYTNQPLSEDAFENLFLERLTDCGGAFFEKFVSNLLEKYFIISGTDVLNCEISGGVNDGGVDIIIDTVEDLGFVARIMIQAKCRKNSQVTEKEVREFYGALNAQNGTKGIYITTSTFHPCAEKLLNSIGNCVGIDGHKIFDLVKRTTYGIRKNKDGYLFDDAIFNF